MQIHGLGHENRLAVFGERLGSQDPGAGRGPPVAGPRPLRSAAGGATAVPGCCAHGGGGVHWDSGAGRAGGRSDTGVKGRPPENQGNP